MKPKFKVARSLPIAGVAATVALLVPVVLGQITFQNTRMPVTPRDWTQDMQMKIDQPFTLASVGDLIIIRPASQFQDPALQGALKIIRDADVGFGNFESLIRDETHFDGPLGGEQWSEPRK